MNKILVTGAAGYIGSHTCVELLSSGYEIVAVDDFRNSKLEVVSRIKELAGKDFRFVQADAADVAALRAAFEGETISAVIHFAGLKAVGESVEKPLEYYRNNLNTTMVVLDCMERYGVKRIVFSSSATVYGIPETVPIAEDARLTCTNPYGWTKYMNEQILRDQANAQKDFSVVLLRYFNPIGAHESGLIGDDPKGIPNNLLPYITQVASGRREFLNVLGKDHPTPEATAVKYKIQMTDLVYGHSSAMEDAAGHTGAEAINLGTGRGYSVLDVVKTYERVSGVRIPYKIAPRRHGDIAECYADSAKARRLLGWRAERTLDDMCLSAHNWQTKNPAGYL